MKLPFVKMHGAGNDFVVFDFRSGRPPGFAAAARRVADRHFGIGADQLLLLESSPESGAEFRMGVLNADGNEVEMCGNGIRCFAKYLRDRGLISADEVRVHTDAGIMVPTLLSGNRVRVDMGEPILEAARIPVKLSDPVVDTPLEVDGQAWRVTCVSMGNPHCVVYVDDVDGVEVPAIGPSFEDHAVFPQRVNTEFIQVVSRTHLRMRVWERGAGETLACGTGACAALVATVLNDKCDRKATLSLRGGDLEIEWSEADGHVYMTGPAVEVFSGEVDLEQL